MGLELKTDRHPPITSQTRYPLRHAASIFFFDGKQSPSLFFLTVNQNIFDLQNLSYMADSLTYIIYGDDLRRTDGFNITSRCVPVLFDLPEFIKTLADNEPIQSLTYIVSRITSPIDSNIR